MGTRYDDWYEIPLVRSFPGGVFHSQLIFKTDIPNYKNNCVLNRMKKIYIRTTHVLFS